MQRHQQAPTTLLPHIMLRLLLVWPLQQKSRFSITVLSLRPREEKGLYLCNEGGYEGSHSGHSAACSQAQSTRGCRVNL